MCLSPSRIQFKLVWKQGCSRLEGEVFIWRMEARGNVFLWGRQAIWRLQPVPWRTCWLRVPMSSSPRSVAYVNSDVSGDVSDVISDVSSVVIPPWVTRRGGKWVSWLSSIPLTPPNIPAAALCSPFRLVTFAWWIRSSSYPSSISYSSYHLSQPIGYSMIECLAVYFLMVHLLFPVLQKDVCHR